MPFWDPFARKMDKSFNQLNIAQSEQATIRREHTGALDDVGIYGQMRSALLNPKHAQIRGIQTMSLWLCEMMETNYDALVGLEDSILSKIDPAYPSHRCGGFDTDCTVPATPGGHINLFKSVALKRAKHVIAEDGTIDLVPLLSYPPTDFAHRGGLYFTHQMCTIEIAVPLDHLTKENMLTLDFGDIWKELDFYSRRDQSYPKDLRRLRRNHNIIHGPIAHNANIAFAKMKDPSGIEKEAFIHVWLNEEAVNRLSEVVKEKTWMRKPEQGYALVESPWKE
ncbi:hypothetical protein DPSP01_009530 [Paraphaeosphaeria sporulosa]|uniref:Uncharacterized protein n=1 Tax=Paraphaeosphaeria sporulosa TaxID=1460663 RepID=A0A177C0B6_9PLEO|nr:uncharacterized protein CC84DRAFT_1180277 [Paraphaeosphaeria sporulosa]OAG01234.1 hypothetical protein CC84DRAFT_1180277 [Paraphaeosphaeria sporulosa]